MNSKKAQEVLRKIKSKKMNSWTLFNRMFRLGHEVILITDEDKFEWGTIIEITDDGITLKRKWSKVKERKWENVVFLSHDGFPVRKLPPSPSDKHVEKILTDPKIKDFHGAVRKALAFNICAECGKITEETYTEYIDCKGCRTKRRQSTYTGGHPWQIEGVTSEIFNIGNESDYFWSNHPLEETIVMKSKDGLGGQLWDLPAVFEFEHEI